MNAFFTDNILVAKINICVLVKTDLRRSIHTNRPFHGLVTQLSGSAKYVFSTGETLHLHPGAVIFLPKYANYDAIGVEAGECIAINFDLLDSQITYPPFVYFSGYNHCLSSFKKALRYWETKQDGHLNHCMKHLYELICCIQTEGKQYTPSFKKQTACAAAEYIARNLSDNELSVAEVAGKLKVSPEYLRKIFKASYGISPRQYLIVQRINRAIELISLREFKINEISNMCGFKDPNYFSTEFKKVTSYTPTEYANQLSF